MHAHITAHRGRLILELLVDRSIAGEVATSLDQPGNMGQVIMDTAKHLGVSSEALALLQTLRRGTDSLGDVDWFQSGTQHTFGWMGGPKTIRDPVDVSPSRDWCIGPHQVIANAVPQGAKDHFDSLLGSPDASTTQQDDAAQATTEQLTTKTAKVVDKVALLQRICREMELSRAEYQLLAARLG